MKYLLAVAILSLIFSASATIFDPVYPQKEPTVIFKDMYLKGLIKVNADDFIKDFAENATFNHKHMHLNSETETFFFDANNVPLQTVIVSEGKANIYNQFLSQAAAVAHGEQCAIGPQVFVAHEDKSVTDDFYQSVSDLEAITTGWRGVTAAVVKEIVYNTYPFLFPNGPILYELGQYTAKFIKEGNATKINEIITDDRDSFVPRMVPFNSTHSVDIWRALWDAPNDNKKCRIYQWYFSTNGGKIKRIFNKRVVGNNFFDLEGITKVTSDTGVVSSWLAPFAVPN